MKLPEKINPVHCASNDPFRHVLQSVAIQGDLAIACDGKTLFVAKGTREEDDDSRDALIPKRAASAAWPQRKKSRGAILPMLTINKSADCTILSRDMDNTTIKEIDGNYPKIEKIIPDSSVYTHRVGMNVKLLANIAKCFGDDEVAIHFDSNKWEECQWNAPMIITSKTNDAFAVLMPCRTNDCLLEKNNALKAAESRKQNA